MSSITYITKNDHYWNNQEDLIEITSDIGYSFNSSTDNPNAYYSFNKSLNNFNIESGLLPPGLRLSLPGFLIFERPPSMKLVQYVDLSVESMCEYEEEEQDYSTNVYEIPIPWQLYFVTYSTSPDSMYRTTQVSMFFMNSPLVNSQVKLYAPYINNFFTNCTLCSPMFDDAWEINRYSQDLSGVISSAYDWVWNTGFNADLKECIDQTLCQKIDNHIVRSFMNDYRSGLMNGSMYQEFYKHISNYSIEDVVSLPWANPSYMNYHSLDPSFIYDNGLSDFSYDEECEESEEEQFRNYIGDATRVSKTYSDIIESTFFLKSSRDYRHITKSSNSTFENIDKLAYNLNLHIRSNRPISS